MEPLLSIIERIYVKFTETWIELNPLTLQDFNLYFVCCGFKANCSKLTPGFHKVLECLIRQ